MASKTPLIKHTKLIDLPGQPVNLETGTDTTVILRKHRDVIFNFDLKSVKKIEVKVLAKSVAKSTLYDPKQKKLIKELVIPNRTPYPVWVGREFNADIQVFADGKLIGEYNPKKLDTTPIDPAPPFKPQPILIGFKEAEHSNIGQCTPDDPYGTGVMFAKQKPWLESNFDFMSSLKDLQNYQFNNLLPEAVPEQKAVMHLLSPDVIAAKNMQEGAEVSLPFTALGQYLTATQAQILLNSIDNLSGNTLFKTVSDYAIANRGWLERMNGDVRLKKVRGQLMLVWVGRSDPSKFKNLPGTTYGLGNQKVAGVTGGYTIKTNQPFRRFALSALQTTGKNALDGMKMPKALGTFGFVLDVYGDFRKVFADPKGSKDVTEFLGRAGVSLLSAGASAALGGALAGWAVASIAALGTLPVAIVVAVGLAAFLVASYVVDATLGSSSVKDAVGGIAR